MLMVGQTGLNLMFQAVQAVHQVHHPVCQAVHHQAAVQAHQAVHQVQVCLHHQAVR